MKIWVQEIKETKGVRELMLCAYNKKVLQIYTYTFMYSKYEIKA